VANRSAAEIFGKIFTDLADPNKPVDFINARPVLYRDEFARWLWDLARQCDFHPSDMECGEALKALGLARRRPPDDLKEYGPAYDPDWIYDGGDS
jgi:hypothetical protein